jgi:hypothetical protein
VQDDFSSLRHFFDAILRQVLPAGACLPQYSYSYKGQPLDLTRTPADYGIRNGQRVHVDVIGLPPGLRWLDAQTELRLLKKQQQREASRKAAEAKLAEEKRIAERTRPRRVLRVVRTGTSTTRSAMYLLQLEGDTERCHWATADHCSPALKQLLLSGQRDGFTEEHTVSLPVEPLKERRKTQRCRDARSTDYAVRAADAARVRRASKNKSEDEKLQRLKANAASQRK